MVKIKITCAASSDVAIYGIRNGDVYIVEDPRDYDGVVYIKEKKNRNMAGWQYTVIERDINSNGESHKSNIMSNLIKLYKNLVTPEPLKSFQKAGIIGEDGNMTLDGKTLFVEWLFAKNQTEFKTDVVDAIIKEQENDAK